MIVHTFVLLMTSLPLLLATLVLLVLFSLRLEARSICLLRSGSSAAVQPFPELFWSTTVGTDENRILLTLIGRNDATVQILSRL